MIRLTFDTMDVPENSLLWSMYIFLQSRASVACYSEKNHDKASASTWGHGSESLVQYNKSRNADQISAKMQE